MSKIKSKITALIRDKRNQKGILIATAVIALGIGYWGIFLTRPNPLRNEIELSRLVNSYSLPDPTRTKSCFGDEGIYEKVKNVCYDFVDTMYYVASEEELADLVAVLAPYLNTLDLTSYTKSILPEDYETNPYSRARTISIEVPNLRTPEEIRKSLGAQLSIYASQTKADSPNSYNLAAGIQDSALSAVKDKQGLVVVLSIYRKTDR